MVVGKNIPTMGGEKRSTMVRGKNIPTMGGEKKINHSWEKKHTNDGGGGGEKKDQPWEEHKNDRYGKQALRILYKKCTTEGTLVYTMLD